MIWFSKQTTISSGQHTLSYMRYLARFFQYSSTAMFCSAKSNSSAPRRTKTSNWSLTIRSCYLPQPWTMSKKFSSARIYRIKGSQMDKSLWCPKPHQCLFCLVTQTTSIPSSIQLSTQKGKKTMKEVSIASAKASQIQTLWRLSLLTSCRGRWTKTPMLSIPSLRLQELFVKVWMMIKF